MTTTQPTPSLESIQRIIADYRRWRDSAASSQEVQDLEAHLAYWERERNALYANN